MATTAAVNSGKKLDDELQLDYGNLRQLPAASMNLKGCNETKSYFENIVRDFETWFDNRAEGQRARLRLAEKRVLHSTRNFDSMDD